MVSRGSSQEGGYCYTPSLPATHTHYFGAADLPKQSCTHLIGTADPSQLSRTIFGTTDLPKQSCTHLISTADPSQLSRTVLSSPSPRLLPGYNSRTLSPPSAIAISTAFGLRAHSSPSSQPSGFISLLLLPAHSPLQ